MSAFIMCVALVPSPASAAAGDLDTSFSGDGIVTSSFYSGGTAVLVDPNGKIIVGGTANSRPSLVRYNANGSLDTTFSGDGKRTLPTLGWVDDLFWRGTKIVVLTGTTLFQIKPRGGTDRTYGGGDGQVQLPEAPTSVQVDAATGTVYMLSDTEWDDPYAQLRKIVGESVVDTEAVHRFTGGWDPDDPDYYGDSITDIALTADGSSLYVVGYGVPPGGVSPYPRRVAVATRFRTSDLTEMWSEPTYGPEFSEQYGASAATTIARNGKLITMGDSWVQGDGSSGQGSTILRIGTDGTVEMVSGLTGWDTQTDWYDLRWGAEIFMQDAKIVVVGTTADQTAEDLNRGWTVWRLTAQGEADPDFGGGDGILRTPSGSLGGDTGASDGAVWNGRIIAVGGRNVVRYLAP